MKLFLNLKKLPAVSFLRTRMQIKYINLLYISLREKNMLCKICMYVI